MITSIGNFKLDKTFIIAELSANHNHDFNIAVKTIEQAAKAGADAIKTQTYTADTITIDCDNEYFQIKQGTIWDGKTL
ncbi:MAG: pseudaminic acid synthase, partial [Bacteroidetes bacterium]|nr:pseudaminic acid synthase [Bacteroidota bacterium]